MLSPSINQAKSQLAEALDEVLQLDNYGLTAGNIILGRLPEDPEWLQSARSRISMLGTAGVAWMVAKPGIWSSVLLPFLDYASAFDGVASRQDAQPSGSEWSTLLKTVLAPELPQAIAATDAATAAVHAHRTTFDGIQPLLAASIDEGWAELADEEQTMTQIAYELGQIQSQVEALAGDIGPEAVSGGADITSNSVQIIYDIAMDAGGAINFLTVITSVFTVGKSFYDLVEQTKAISDGVEKIAALKLQASEAAQAAAGTKLVLRLIYDLELSFRTITDVLPQIAQLWRDEREKVQDAIDALAHGADPSTYFDLIALSAANANWQAIASFVQAISGATSSVGKPVILRLTTPQAAPSSTGAST
jgi:hypothetical protein